MKQRHRQSSTKRTQHLATGIAVLGYWWLTLGSRPRSSAFERPRCAITLFFFPRSFSAVGKFSGAGLFYWAASRHRLCLCWPISRCAFGREGVSPDLPLPGLFVAKRLLSFFTLDTFGPCRVLRYPTRFVLNFTSGIQRSQVSGPRCWTYTSEPRPQHSSIPL